MKTEFYKQCRFKKDKYETIAYIPSWAAVVGNKVQLLTLDGEFWEVVEAGNEVSADFVKENERNYKEFQGSTRGGGID